MTEINNQQTNNTPVSSDTTSNVPEHCPGTSSDLAGKSSACEGCPNQQICSTSNQNEEDVDVPLLRQRLENVEHVVLVLSGKGGVGKSFLSSQLSLLLAKDADVQVGLLDVDVCGPSIPKLLNVEDEIVHNSSSGITPVYSQDNLAVMSIGFLLNNKDEAVIWRGNKKSGLIKQFIRDVDWDQLNYLIVDTPPGTSDEHLSIVKFINSATKIDGAVLITTPQEVALQDVAKELDFCRKLRIPVLGLVENMSQFTCQKCKHITEIFKPTTGGAQRLATEWNTKVLGKIPISLDAMECSENGKGISDEKVLMEIENIARGIVNEMKRS